MTYLTLENINKAFGEKILLKNVTFSIEEGQKVALVAKNGSGKTTLLRIIIGQEVADNGKVIKKSGLQIGYLDQNPIFHGDHTLLEALLNSNSTTVQAVKMYEESLLDPENMDKMQHAFELMDKNNAWDLDTLIRDILVNLKLPDLNQKVNELSGGQVKRLAIAKLLIDSPDLVILDEPTNHLDVEIIDWLEGFLTSRKMTLLMVTHDRYFLDRICDTIIELDGGNMHTYQGNYELFLMKKNERESNELVNAQKTAVALKRERMWVDKMPQGRGSKSTARTSNYYDDASENKHLKSFIRERSTKIEINMKNTRLGSKILEFNNVSKSFGAKKILDKFSYIFKQHEKLGIIGKNGVGKSTFLNLIMKEENPDSGFITYGETIEFGYYNQNGIKVDDNKTILDSVKDVAEYTTFADGTKATASQLLEKFLFHPRIQHKFVNSLSGGEKRRLYLLTVILKNPNFLILDEPTNDFDLTTLDLLEEFLINYKGCLIIVSHDRYFMDLIVDHLFVFEGNGEIKDFPGNYSDYKEHGFSAIDETNPQNSEVLPSIKSEQMSDTQKDKIKKLEKKIKNLEIKRKDLESKISQTELFEEIRKISEEIKLVVEDIEKASEEWIALSE